MQLTLTSGILKTYGQVMRFCLLLACFLLSSAAQAQGLSSWFTAAEQSFQQDADVIRSENLLHWSGLLEAYFTATGYYPLSDTIPENKLGVMVRIGTAQQQSYFMPNDQNYIRALDYNTAGRFENAPTSSLITVLNAGLKTEVIERYDIQKVPTTVPVWLHYFVTKDGYLLWTPCKTCTPSEAVYVSGKSNPFGTFNIASAKIAASNAAFFQRKNMLAHPDFQKLLTRPLNKPDYVKALVADQARHWQSQN